MANLLFQVATIVLIVLSLAVGIYTITGNSRARVNQLWFASMVFVSLWAGGLYALTLSQTLGQAILSSKLLHFTSVFIPILFFHFVVTFLFKAQDYKKNIVGGYAVAVILAVLSFTKLIVASASPKFGFDFWVDVGILYPVFLLYFWFYVLYSLVILAKSIKTTDGVIRRKVIYILIAGIVSFGGGGTNFLPQTIGVYPFGQFVTWLYPLLITWGVFLK